MKRILNFLSRFFKVFGVINDISNYYYIKRITKKESKNSPIWSKNNLRVDWIGRIYTVMTLPPEITMSRDLPKEVWPAYLIEQSKGLNEYLTSLNLHEIITPEYKEIPDSPSYLLVYTPYFRNLSWRWVISRISFWTVALYLEHRTHCFSTAYHWVISFF
jgi:hypothetical protein